MPQSLISLRLCFLTLHLCILGFVASSQPTFYIESRDAPGQVTDLSLYEEIGDWYGPGSTAKSKAAAPELPGGTLQGLGSRFSFNTTTDAAFLVKISAHPDFFPDQAYDIYITTPKAPTIDAFHSTFLLFDAAHPPEAPLRAGPLPLTYKDCGDVWYKIAGGVVLGSGATLKVSESAPQGDRFYADAVKIQPAFDSADISIGRSAFLDDPSRWLSWTSVLGQPSPGATVQATPDGLVFHVPEPGHEMRWRHSLRPAWMDTHYYLTFDYRISGRIPDGVFPVLRLCTTWDSWFTAMLSTGLHADGNRHTAMVNLKALTAHPQIIGIEIALVSDASSSATLEIRELAFRDQLPDFRYPPASPPAPVATGFDLDRGAPAAFVPKPTWVDAARISGDYGVTADADSLFFSVRDSGKGMKWLNTAIGNHDTSAYSLLYVKYRCKNIRKSASDYAVFLAGNGEARPLYLADLNDDGAWQYTLRPIAIPSVFQLAIQVQSDLGGNAFLEIGQLAFLDGDPRADLTYFVPVVEEWDGLASPTELFTFLDLTSHFNFPSDQLLPRMGISRPWFTADQLAADARIPFQVGTGPLNLLATTLPGTTAIELPVGRSASEVYLLLGAYFPARENPMSEITISDIDETERFVAELVYSDGSNDLFFPLDVSSRRHRIRNNTFTPLAFPADPAKRIDLLRLHDGSDGGLFALAAVTLKNSSPVLYGDFFSVPPALPSHRASEPPGKAPRVVFTSPTLVLENTHARYEFNLSAGLAFAKWISGYTGHNLLQTAPDPRLFSGRIDGIAFTSLDFIPDEPELLTADGITTVVLPLRLKGHEASIPAVLTITLDDSPRVHFAMKLENRGGVNHAFELNFPDLPGLTLGPDSRNLRYAYPRETFIESALPIHIATTYSGYFPMQFMALHDPSEGWGSYLLVRDLQLITKDYGLCKGEEDAALWVRYPTLESVGLRAGAPMELAPFTLGLYAGGWHEAMKAYREWVTSWYQPRSPRQRWFQDVYTCRRDYPTGGTWFLFDRPNNRYTFPNAIENAARYLGAADMFDISSWAWSAASGRVGDYRVYELGGLENFREGIALSQARDIPVGLYIEGYSIDERSSVYKAHGEQWQMIRADGTEYRTDTEVTMCPYPSGWQEHMKQLYADVVGDTGAACMYLDVYGRGTRRCYSSDHGHDVGEIALRGEYQMTCGIREGLNALRPGIPLYTEYTPTDFTSQFQDGSFSYTIFYGDAGISPTMTNLFRYCFPDFKQIELVNGLFLARNWTEEGLKKAFLNGEGIWIKGDIPAWYDPNTIHFYAKSHEIYRDHRDAFASENPEPLIPTRIGEVYANRFAAPDKQIVMLYNANRCTVRGSFVEFGLLDTDTVHAVELWGERMLVPSRAGDETVIASFLPPREIGCIGLFPKCFDARFAGGVLTIRDVVSAPGAELELVGVTGHSRVSSALSGAARDQNVALADLFLPLPDKLLVKFRKDGIVVDMIILEELTESLPPEGSGWISR
jgi:hypothetical protein